MIDVTLPEVLGQGESVQNYDMSTSQTIVYGEVSRRIATEDADLFQGRKVELRSSGLVQQLDPGANTVLAKFEDGSPALVLIAHGQGRLYYLAAPLAAEGYLEVLAPLADQAGITRPVLGLTAEGRLVTGAEVRAVERERDLLIYASNLTGAAVEFELVAADGGKVENAEDLRGFATLQGAKVSLKPWQETIYRVTKGN